MSQQFGICTWTLGIDDLETLMSTIAESGLNSVQYCESMSAHKAEDVVRMAQKYNLDLLIFDPFDCRPSEENGEASLEGAVAFYQRVVDYAKQLGCGATLQGLSAWTSQCNTQEAAWAQLVESVKRIQAYAETQQVHLSYEPCNLYEVPLIHTTSDFQALVNDSQCEDLSILLDSFHMNIGESDPLLAAEHYAAKNAIFHVSDSNREGIGHGNIDFLEHYEALQRGGFDGPIVFEFVLSNNPANTPPRNDHEMHTLLEHVKQSQQAWSSFSAL